MRTGENVKKVRRGVEKLPEENSIKGNMGRRRIMRKILQRQWQQQQHQQQQHQRVCPATSSGGQKRGLRPVSLSVRPSVFLSGNIEYALQDRGPKSKTKTALPHVSGPGSGHMGITNNSLNVQHMLLLLVLLLPLLMLLLLAVLLSDFGPLDWLKMLGVGGPACQNFCFAIIFAPVIGEL